MNTNRSTVIVVHDTNLHYDYDSVRNWFASSDFNACEAIDLFDAVDAISDFTNPIGLDVVLVRMKPGSQLDRIPEVLDANGDLFEIPVAILSDTKHADEKRPYNFGSLGRLKVKLDADTIHA